MSFPKIVGIIALILFGLIACAVVLKGKKNSSEIITATSVSTPIEVELNLESVHIPAKPAPKEIPVAVTPPTAPPKEVKKTQAPVTQVAAAPEVLPNVDRIHMLFDTHGPKLGFIETLSYKSRVDWMKGRPAWLSDYAGYYKTSRHFIARSLNSKPDYFKQDIGNGDRFNVFRRDVDLSFYLVIDTSRCKMWFYAYTADNKERTLLKTYDVSLGRIDSSSKSGLLTPLGKYSLGDKVAIYKPKTMGLFNGVKTEMIRVFGTRWIPFESEIEDATQPAKGFGIHGVPWVLNKEGVLTEDASSLGKYESDGCIRLSTVDVEELFAVIITKPTTVELVRDFAEAHLPGIEKP